MTARPAPLDAPALPAFAVVGVLAAHAAVKAAVFSGPFQDHVATPLAVATGGVVSSVTASGVVSWVALVGVAMCGWAGLRPRDLGLSWASVRDALPVLLWVWILVQAAQAALGSATGDLSVSAPSGGASVAVARALQEVVGAGLLEEVVYRGFLLVQVFGLLRARVSRDAALVGAVALTSLYFGVNHVPTALSWGLSAGDAAGYVLLCVLAGVLFAGLYLRTGNLVLAAGGHSLLNAPAPLFSTPVDPALVVLVALCALVLAWPWLARRLPDAFPVGQLEGRPAV